MKTSDLFEPILTFLDCTGPQELCQVIRACRTANPTCPPTRVVVYWALQDLQGSGDVEQIVDTDGIIYYQLNR